ncbi:M17 family metallopeptidase [Xanthomarina sp. F1114]|uniref:leucyl aminopeptidase family protein n=1 Tax=Xanthomarina sp. F1114 TaxID=2996019 RepID=UPI00225DE7CE|nr:M17 family metallopeptidase [Xanthomarina sp. F1114]MCX7546830.1 M17 family metallopeptidase [Xanthomarina sp. F1114]
MIKQGELYSKDGHIAFIIGKEFQTVEGVSPLVEEQAKKFIASDDETDYLKLGDRFIFFVKEHTDLEKLRVAGHDLRTKLDQAAEDLFISGKGAQALALAEGLALSNYQFLKYFKEADKKRYRLKNIILLDTFEAKAISNLNHTTKAVYWSRDMVNEPLSYLTAVQLSKEIKAFEEVANVSVTVFDKAKIEALNMGGLLAVNLGSIDPPTFTIIEYKPNKPKNKKPIVLVGKGVVYDTGGMSIKPTAGSMDSMKSDMGGAACMAGAIYAAAMNELDLHIIALIPATDNRPGGNAYVPGDVIKMYDGTTVEVLNTDAEGRMILADALAYSNELDPELVIDAATLTGAAVAAIGQKASCVMGNAEQDIINALINSGYHVHERLAQMPFWDDYAEDIKSSIADMKNLGGKYAGSITAGKFLEHFVKSPYIHLDIAGPAFLDAVDNYKGKGGTGVGVRLLNNFLENY